MAVPCDLLPATPADPFGSAEWTALGTYVHLVVADGSRLEAVRQAAADLLRDIDRSCSRFREDSDLTRANRSAGRWVKVDPLLCRAVLAALDAAEETDGLVDPTLGAVLAGWGYDRDLDQVRARPGSDPVALPPPVALHGWTDVQVDPDGGLLVPDGTALDLGATGKAFAADLIAERVPGPAGTALVVSLGGDVAVGLLDDDDEPTQWPVQVAEQPEQVDAGCETVLIEAGGLATSTTTRRRWVRAGRPVHHLLDPRTGAPVEPVWRTATVSAHTCLAANTASTAAIILGTAAPQWLADRDLAGRLVHRDGQVVRINGWPDPEDDS